MCFPYAGEGTFQYSNNTTTTTTSSTTHTINNTASTETPCLKTTHYVHQNVVAWLKVIPLKNGNPCEGRVNLNSLQKKGQLCLNGYPLNWNELCKDMRCGKFKGFIPTNKAIGLSFINNVLNKSLCHGLQITCEGMCVCMFIFREGFTLYIITLYVGMFRLMLFFLSGFIDKI